jgi:hypothetical protein
VRAFRAVFAIAALLSLLLILRIRGDTAWLGALLNASHALIFALVAVILFEWLGRGREVSAEDPWPDWPRIALVLLVSVILGIVIEFIQQFEERPASLFDVATDLAGAAIGLGLWSLWQRRRTRSAKERSLPGTRILVAIVLVAVTFVLWRPLEAARAYAHRAAAFPVIAEFRSSTDLYFLSRDNSQRELAQLPTRWATHEGERALRIHSSPEHGASVQLLEPEADWRGYSVVAVDLTNPADRPVSLVFRILDAHHDWSHEDRLNLPLVVPAQSRTTVRVALSQVEGAPEGRSMDLSAIANVMLFGRREDHPVELFVSRIWLE